MKEFFHRCNPLWSSDTALPPLTLLGAKLLVLYLLLHDLDGPGREPFLPLLPWLDRPVFGGTFGTLLDLSSYLAMLTLFFNRAPRFGAFWIGLTTLWMVLADRTLFSNSTCFAAFLLLLTGLHTPAWGHVLIRAQLVLLYAGAMLNKVWDPDWRSGRFIAAWVREDLESHWFSTLEAQFPAWRLPLLLGWLIILVELLLALGFAVPRFQRHAILLGVCFHGGMLVFTRGELSLRFGFLMPVAYLLLVAARRPPEEWPAQGNESSPPAPGAAKMATQ